MYLQGGGEHADDPDIPRVYLHPPDRGHHVLASHVRVSLLS